MVEGLINTDATCVLLKKNNAAAISIGIALFSGIMCLLLPLIISGDKASLGSPGICAIALFIAFCAFLKTRIKTSLFGELGFIYLAIAVAYTVLPVIIYMIIDINIYVGWQRLSDLLPSEKEFARHLWRHNIFIIGVAFGYLLFRNKKKATMLPTQCEMKAGDGLLIVTLIGMILLCSIGTLALSAPVSSYIEHYTRYDHLSWLLLRIVYVSLLLKAGLYYILMYYLFINYNKYKYIAWLIIAVICYYEFTYSYGSRIHVMTLILAAMVLYQFLVKAIKWKKGLSLFVAIALLASLMEYIRSANYHGTPSDDLNTKAIMPAAEFGAILFTGYHLYSERERNALPDRPWQMFLSDFISVIPFADHVRWHPQYWYARNYFPDAIVPPETMGPIADSALWGGELDLLLRSIINGAFFAWLVRILICDKSIWWRHIIYIYICGTCIMTLKYSVFYSLSSALQNLLLALIAAKIIKLMCAFIKYNIQCLRDTSRVMRDDIIGNGKTLK